MILITLTRSEDEIVAGIPQWIEIEASVLSSIFYTLDGTDPTEFSDIYTGRIFLPGNVTSITIKAFAMTGVDSSSVLEQSYSLDIQEQRFRYNKGIVVLDTDGAFSSSFAFDEDGNPVKKTDLNRYEMELKPSISTRIGEPLNGISTTLFFIKKQLSNIYNENHTIVTTNKSVNFNPNAKVIYINSETQQDIAEQIIPIINRPLAPMTDLKTKNNGIIRQTSITSNFVMQRINPQTGKMCSYYYDRLDNKWIMSTTIVEPQGMDLGPTISPPQSFVYKWVKNRTMTKI